LAAGPDGVLEAGEGESATSLSSLGHSSLELISRNIFGLVDHFTLVANVEGLGWSIEAGGQHLFGVTLSGDAGCGVKGVAGRGEGINGG
jgi:hypothetical protein